MIIRCDVGAVKSSLVDAPPDVFKALRDALAVPVKNAYFAKRARPGWDGSVKFYSASGSFYTGLLPRVADVVEVLGNALKLVDKRGAAPVRIVPKTSKVTLRDYQEAVVDAAFEAERCTVKAATNSGKSECAIVLSARWGARVLFIVPTVELCEQTAARFRNAFPSTVKVATLTESGGRLTDTGAAAADIVVANVQGLGARCLKRFQTVKRRPDGSRYAGWRYGPIHAAGAKFLARFGTLFGDEVHGLSSDSWSKVIGACPARYRVALSATPDASGDKVREFLRVGLFGEVITEVKQEFLRDAGHSVPVTVKLIRYVPGPPLPASWALQYLRGIVACDARNAAFARQIAEDVSAGMRCLVLVERYEHANRLWTACAAASVGARSMATAFGSNRETRPDVLRDFKSGRVPVIFATRVLGTGVDLKEIDRLFIAAAGGAEDAVSVQRGGRLVRFREGKDAVLYDGYDADLHWDDVTPSKRHLERHFRRRLKAYAGEGFRIER